MAKPIFITGIPLTTPVESTKDISIKIAKQLNDYHVICYVHSGNEIKFDVFYEKDFNKVKYEELKKYIKQLTKTKL